VRTQLAVQAEPFTTAVTVPWLAAPLRQKAEVTGGLGFETVMSRLPVWPWYVAVMVVVPTVFAVTSPVAETVATAVLEDCHVAREVTFCVVPFVSVSVALSWLVEGTSTATSGGSQRPSG
jgi:hypothetical protein